MQSKICIGVFDSGLGGLTVLREIRRAVPQADLVYLGDTARTPYGSKSVNTIQQYARECADFLRAQEIDLLVVACNTASSVALGELQRTFSIPVLGTIEPAVDTALALWRGGSVAVIGTDATIASQIYETTLRSRRREIEVISRSCPLFVPLVEQGMLAGEIVEKVVELYLAPIVARKPEAVILACTHYPLLRDALEQYLGPEVTIVECSKAIAERCQALFPAHTSAPQGTVRYFVTDAPSKFNFLAREFLKDQDVAATAVELLTAH